MSDGDCSECGQPLREVPDTSTAYCENVQCPLGPEPIEDEEADDE